MQLFPELKTLKLALAVTTVLLIAALPFTPIYSQEDSELTVAQLMNSLIVPMTGVIWGAYDIKEDAQWLELENAAYTVIAAGNLLSNTGADASNEDWQEFNTQMINAAKEAIVAISNKDEEALFNAGNDQLYPPCESCHQKYMAQ